MLEIFHLIRKKLMCDYNSIYTIHKFIYNFKFNFLYII